MDRIELQVKFICTKHYDFEKDGQRIVGDNLYVYDYQINDIIKVAIRNFDSIKDCAFGDVITIYAIPNGRYLKYEV